jgi:methyl coenzyme M reductase subunit D
MNEIDKLRMDRRKIEVEIKRLEEKLIGLKEDKAAIDRRITMIQQSGNTKDGTFKTSLFG